MVKLKPHLQKGNSVQGNKKSSKQENHTLKKKSKMRTKIYVKGGLRDGQAEISTTKQGVEDKASKNPAVLESASKDTQIKKLSGIKKKFRKRKKLSVKKVIKDVESESLAEGQKPKVPVKVRQTKNPEKKVNGKERQSGNVLPVEVKRAVTNIKSSKEKVSSNWEAFKEIGLHKNKEKPSGNSKFEGIFRKRRKAMQGKTDSVIFEKSEDVVESGDLNNLDLEDSYIKDLVPPQGDSVKKLTKCIAIDCEMVGVGDGKESALARISLVNQYGTCLYDKFVKPKEDVIDYRTKVSGVRPADIALGEEFEVVQKEVAQIVAGRVLVGHALKHDLKVLFLSHPFSMTRDTSKFKPFKDMFNGRTPSLKNLALKILGVNIQDGEHSSVVDAKATMQLYNLYSKEWEEQRRLWALRKREKVLKLKPKENKANKPQDV